VHAEIDRVEGEIAIVEFCDPYMLFSEAFKTKRSYVMCDTAIKLLNGLTR